MLTSSPVLASPVLASPVLASVAAVGVRGHAGRGLAAQGQAGAGGHVREQGAEQGPARAEVIRVDPAQQCGVGDRGIGRVEVLGPQVPLG